MRERREMRRLVGLGVLIAVAASGAAVACRSVTCEENKTCTDGVDPGMDGGNDVTVGGDGGPDGPVVPPGCEKSPANGGLVEEKCGVFVSSVKGSDTGAGTRESPVKSVTQGVKLAVDSGKAWVFVCKGTYNETSAVKVEDRAAPLGLFGKLDCDSNWAAGTTRATVKGAADDFVFAFKNATVLIEGLDVQAADAVKPGGSSIAIFANGGELDVVDSVVKAGMAKDGAQGAAGGNALSQQPAGENGKNPGGGNPVACVCALDDAGTLGGGGGSAIATGENGNSGLPSYGASPPDNGAGGVGKQIDCLHDGGAGFGHRGANGSDGDAGPPSGRAGELSAGGWIPGAGNTGLDGVVAQGGGGGGAKISGGGGGGGACGGCGGRGGGGGTGGGASVAIACLNVGARVVTSELVTLGAASGGKGGDGQVGQAGGNGGTGSNGSCQGGAGGTGGTGGKGGGGAGGISAAFLYVGPAPTRDATTKVTLGDAGAPGSPGAFSSAAVEKFEAN